MCLESSVDLDPAAVGRDPCVHRGSVEVTPTLPEGRHTSKPAVTHSWATRVSLRKYIVNGFIKLITVCKKEPAWWLESTGTWPGTGGGQLKLCHSCGPLQ